jgi:N-acetylmuramoyl-L-alanine amidase
MRQQCLGPRAILALAAAALLVVHVAAGSEATPQQLFERAEALYRQLEVVDPAVQSESWAAVVDAFSDVAARYPASPLASEALWRIGWIYGAQADAGDEAAHRRSANAYEQLVDHYPASPRAPEALLRLAAYAEGTSGARAAKLYTRLLQQYPNTPQATLARNRLAVAERRAQATPSPAEESPAADRHDVTSADETPAEGETALSEAESPAVPAEDLATLEGVRYYSDTTHTRVVLDFDGKVMYESGDAESPTRVFLDIPGVLVADNMDGASAHDGEQVFTVGSAAVDRVRVALNRPGVARVVVHLASATRYTLFSLDNPGQPFRIVLDVPTPEVASRLKETRRPPEVASPPLSRQLGLGIHRIVIDPGHGGQQPGAIGRTGITEKQLTLAISLLLAEKLRASGYEVLLTREDDRTLDLSERTEFANRADADLFISVHINAARNRRLSGFETYYLNLATDQTAADVALRENAGDEAALGNLDDVLDSIVKNANKEESSELARSIQDSLVLHLSKSFGEIRDLGVKSAPFFVLVGAKMPSVLVELSFISNEEEEARLKTPRFQEQVVEAILIGTQSFIEQRHAAMSNSSR